MHRPSRASEFRSRRHAALLAVLAVFLVTSGCGRGSSGVEAPPVFDESEINDFAALANDFGLLRPGDRFFIRGDISDLPCDPFDPYAYCDPFDGFLFTAAQPIHVEFRLFMERPGHDFDVCLYDPQLDLTLDCWQSPNDPEVGAVDVFAGGLDFHLVVESFYGTGGYELEIEVFGLGESGPGAPEADAAEGEGVRSIAKRAGVGGDPRPGELRERHAAYASPAPGGDGTWSVERRIDPATGAVEEVRSGDGTPDPGGDRGAPRD